MHCTQDIDARFFARNVLHVNFVSIMFYQVLSASGLRGFFGIRKGYVSKFLELD